MLIGTLSFAVLVLAEEACMHTVNRCQCSIHKPSGTCMRHQGDNNCLMGECNAGYRCDCLGFEICSKRSCAQHTTLGNVIPSEKTPFKCHLSENAGTCVDFVEFVDSVQGARSAQQAADEYNKESSATDQEATDLIKIIEEAYRLTNEAIATIAKQGRLVTEKQFSAVEEEAGAVVDSHIRAIGQKVFVAQDSIEAFRCFGEASKFMAKTQELEDLAVKKEAEERDERKKPENKPACARCTELEKDIGELRQKGHEASVAGGTWAKKGRTHKDSGIKRLKNVQKEKRLAEEARQRCIDMATTILKSIKP